MTANAKPGDKPLETVRDIIFDMEDAIVRIRIATEATGHVFEDVSDEPIVARHTSIHSALYCALAVLEPAAKEIEEKWKKAFELTHQSTAE